MPFCSSCGKEITADANFCYHCGSRVAKPSTVSELEDSASDDKDMEVGANPGLDMENDEKPAQKKRRSGSRISRVPREKSSIDDELLEFFEDGKEEDLIIPGEDEEEGLDAYFAKEIQIAENLLLECSLDEAYAKFKTLAEEGSGRAYIYLGLYDYYKLNRKETDAKHVQECFAKSSECGEKLGEFAALFFAELTEEQRKSALEYSKEIDKDDFVANFILGRVILGEERDKYTGDAVELLRTSERRGFQLAMYELGRYFAFMANDGVSAVSYFAEADDKGYTPATLRLAECYQRGLGVEADSSLAFSLYLKCAKRGIAEAQNRVAMFYEKGIGTDVDLEAAKEWYTKSAEQDFAYAQLNLACLLEEDEAPNSASDALYWCKKAAENNLPEAMCHLGLYYLSGIGTAPDDAMAFKYFSLGAEAGDGEAQAYLGLAYANGLGVDEDPEKAFEWMQKASEKGITLAQFHLGLYYQNGYGCEQNHVEAFWQLKMAADKGHADAQCYLADAYESEKGTPLDFEKAEEYYIMAADQGHLKASVQLASSYECGFLSEKDLNKADFYYKRAAESGEAEYQYQYGRFLDRQSTEDSDDDRSFKWYDLAADQGHIEAKRELAAFYLNGCSYVDEDPDKAIELYEEAAENGDAEAKNELGMLYFKGEYLDKDVQTAIDYFTDAAEGGSNKAMYNLAYCFMNGFGVTKNLDKAYEFAKKAVDHHHPNAKNLLNKILETKNADSRPRSKNEQLYHIMLKYKGRLNYRAMYFRGGEPTPQREQEADRVLKQCYAEFGQEKFTRSYKDGQPGILMIASNDARTVREPYYQDKLLITSRALVTSYNGYFIPLPLITRVAYKNNCLYVGFKKDGQVQTLPIIGLFIGNDGTMLENLINELVAVINS